MLFDDLANVADDIWSGLQAGMNRTLLHRHLRPRRTCSHRLGALAQIATRRTVHYGDAILMGRSFATLVVSHPILAL